MGARMHDGVNLPGKDAVLAVLYKIPTMPTSFIIDSDGVVRWRHEGFRASELSEIRRQLVQTMNGGGAQ